MKDSWPKRIGIPNLKEILVTLDWIYSCLLPEEESPIQGEAREHLVDAMISLRRAVADLEKVENV